MAMLARLTLLLSLAILPHLAVANWGNSDTVSVRNYADPRWDEAIKAVVRDLNAATASMAHAPTFVYARRDHRSCKRVTEKQRSGITICSMADGDMPSFHGNPIGGMAKANISRKKRGGEYITPELNIWWGHIVFNRDRPIGSDLICHEFVHIVTGERDGSRDQDSCMRGYRPTFGAWDVAAIERKYGESR